MTPTNLPSEYETDDKNFAALLRALGIVQTGKRLVPTGDPERPRFYFKFGQREECERIKDASLLGTVTVNYQKFIAEQNAVMDQIFQHKKRNRGFPPGGGDLPPFLAARAALPA